MLFVARQARVANRFAPKQTRRVNAESRTLGLYGASMASWMDSYRATAAVGSTISSTPDCSYNGAVSGTISQPTASKRPLCAVTADVKGFRFDGVDDGLVTSTLALNSTQGVTIASLTYLTATGGCVAEASELTNNYQTAIVTWAGNPGTVAGNAAFQRGNVGDSTVYNNNTYNYSTWFQGTVRGDKSASTANQQLLLYAFGAFAPLSAGSSYTKNTNTYGDFPWYLGWRGSVLPAGSFFFTGTISQIVVFKQALSTDQIADVYRLLYEIAGLGW